VGVVFTGLVKICKAGDLRDVHSAVRVSHARDAGVVFTGLVKICKAGDLRDVHSAVCASLTQETRKADGLSGRRFS